MTEDGSTIAKPVDAFRDKESANAPRTAADRLVRNTWQLEIACYILTRCSADIVGLVIFLIFEH